MLNKDLHLLEEAYLSINKKMPSLHSDKETVTTEPNDVVSAGAMDGPAPGIDMEMVEPDKTPSTDSPVKISIMPSPIEDEGCCEECSGEDEEIDMAIDNLNSIRESIMKIACHCASGAQLETWAQQKLAIAMDNLAGVARSLR
jgi:hypothetical protein